MTQTLDAALRYALEYEGRVPVPGERLSVSGYGIATVVDSHVQSTGYEDSWGQSESSKAWIVVQIGNVLYRKEGYSDSWSEFEWDGPVTLVKATEVSVVKYEPVKVEEFSPEGFADNLRIEDQNEIGALLEGGTYLTDFGPVKCLARWGDGEGYGEEVNRVFEIQGKPYQWTGTYSSWEGVTFYGVPRPVAPRQETVTRYYPV
jgi:hypothetical protein